MTRIAPGGAAICPGIVVHHRSRPVDHRFSYPVSLIWVDPDDPHELTAEHPLWSADRPAPVRFRRRDYLDGTDEPIGPAVRSLVAAPLGHRPTGPVRMLTQPRRWGWLFNPITIYLIWDAPDRLPRAALLEVTNTPWKERTTYAVALESTGDQPGLAATFPKTLHVSPFLDEDHHYRLVVDGADGQRGVPRFIVELDLYPNRIHTPRSDGCDVETTKPSPVLTTRLVVERHRPDRNTMNTALLTNPLATHRVSFGIHRQAAALWRKGVPFVAHPRKRTAQLEVEPSSARVRGRRRRR